MGPDDCFNKSNSVAKQNYLPSDEFRVLIFNILFWLFWNSFVCLFVCLFVQHLILIVLENRNSFVHVHGVAKLIAN